MATRGQKKDLISLSVTRTTASCAIGDEKSRLCSLDASIPVLSCEGACIRGDIARIAANSLARRKGFGRGCSGELLTAPESGMAAWITAAKAVVCVDGCHMGCQSRILENLIDPTAIRLFNAQSVHGKYTTVFAIDEVPECERKAAGEEVAAAIASALADGQADIDASPNDPGAKSGCCGGE
jgi:hypothetical protein